MTLVCDFCGDNLSPDGMHRYPASTIVKQTDRGFVPSRLPSNTADFLNALGVDHSDWWRETVKGNAVEDWGVCRTCNLELKGFIAENSDQQEEVSSQTGQAYCAHFSKQVELVNVTPELAAHLDETLSLLGLGSHVVERTKHVDMNFCQASVPYSEGPKPCAEACVQNSVTASAGFQTLLMLEKATIDETVESYRSKLVDYANMPDHLTQEVVSATKTSKPVTDPAVTNEEPAQASSREITPSTQPDSTALDSRTLVNNRQKFSILAGGILFLMVLLFPPWLVTEHMGNGLFVGDYNFARTSSAGYQFIFTPPSSEPASEYLADQGHLKTSVSIAWKKLLIRLLAVVGMVAGLFLVFKSSAPKKKESA